ncbi:MAG: nitrate- and nitrite sensing domain-containing protein, partial [Actinomycetota bacterium]
MSTLGRIPFRIALAIAVLIPLAAVSVYASVDAVGARGAAQDAADIEISTELSVLLGNLVHETQKERGSTALYVSSEGQAFQTELPAQHDATDVARIALDEFLAEHGDRFDSIATELGAVLDDLDLVDGWRESALSLDATLGELLGSYTGLNNKILATIGASTAGKGDADIRGDAIAYVTFLNGKERSGIERAQLSAVFANDGFAPGQYATVTSLIAIQDSYFSLFETIANPEVLAFYEEKQAEPAVAEVARLEAIALGTDTNAADFDGFGVVPDDWFATMTQRINLLKEVEDFQAAAIAQTAAANVDAASADVRTSILVGLLIIALAGVVSVLIVRTVRRRVIRVNRSLAAIAAGDVDVARLEIGARDELGELEQAFNDMEEMLSTVGHQAEAIADGHISALVLQQQVPGELGEAFGTMVGSLKDMVEQLQGSSQQLAGAAEELTAVSTSMSSSAERTSSEATSASATGDQVSASVGTVAAAIEEMNASIREVSTNATEASDVANNAVEVARATSESVAKLGESSVEIGNVIKVINSIAEQTNLLALNATIE